MSIKTDLIISTEYLRRGENLAAAVRVSERTDAVLSIGGSVYPETSNRVEPFDYATHLFSVPEQELKKHGGFTITLTCRKTDSLYFENGKGDMKSIYIDFDERCVVPDEVSINRSDRGLRLTGLTGSIVGSGVRHTVEVYNTPEGLPVRVYILTVEPGRCSFVTGTPFGQLAYDGRTQTVMEEALGVKARGYSVLAAVNADFYDMFGDCRPSGLCISGGTVVANPDCDRYFFGVTLEDKPVISRLCETSVEKLREAVSGMPLIVENGMINDVAATQPFGELPHPRTAVGLRQDGTVLLMVVDGRRPAWSNGASLTELSRLMISHGAVTALNLDGGGSSTFIIDTPDGLTMLNHPADKIRPSEDLIRPVFDSITVVAK